MTAWAAWRQASCSRRNRFRLGYSLALLPTPGRNKDTDMPRKTAARNMLHGEVLVNNAGLRCGSHWRRPRWPNGTARSRSNVRGAAHLCAAELPEMQARRFGRVINIAASDLRCTPSKADQAEAAKGWPICARPGGRAASMSAARNRQGGNHKIAYLRLITTCDSQFRRVEGRASWPRWRASPRRRWASTPAKPRRDGKRLPVDSTVRVTARNPAQLQIMAVRRPDIPAENTRISCRIGRQSAVPQRHERVARTLQNKVNGAQNNLICAPSPTQRPCTSSVQKGGSRAR